MLENVVTLFLVFSPNAWSFLRCLVALWCDTPPCVVCSPLMCAISINTMSKPNPKKALLKDSDIARLEPGRELNDEIANVAAMCMQAKAHTNGGALQRARMH